MSVPTTVGVIATQIQAPLDVVSLQTATAFEDLDATTTKSYSFSGLPTGLSGNTATGAITGTPSAGSYTVTLTCTPLVGTPASRTFPWLVSGAPTAAQTYWIDDVNGNDAWTGLSQTYTSGTTGPWKTIPRCNNVQPHASGNVAINVMPGTYRGQVWTPQNSGTDNTHRIDLYVGADGIVDWMGPASGQQDRAVQIGDGWDELGEGTYTIDFVGVRRTSETQYFRFNGEVVFGTGGGECTKGDDVTAFGHLESIGHFNGTGIIIEGAALGTIGWSGFHPGPDIDQLTVSLDWERHGTSHHSDGNDFGDPCWIDQSIPVGA